eukprot:489834-Rhodomonas_salina.3
MEATLPRKRRELWGGRRGAGRSDAGRGRAGAQQPRPCVLLQGRDGHVRAGEGVPGGGGPGGGEARAGQGLLRLHPRRRPGREQAPRAGPPAPRSAVQAKECSARE